MCLVKIKEGSFVLLENDEHRTRVVLLMKHTEDYIHGWISLSKGRAIITCLLSYLPLSFSLHFLVHFFLFFFSFHLSSFTFFPSDPLSRLLPFCIPLDLLLPFSLSLFLSRLACKLATVYRVHSTTQHEFMEWVVDLQRVNHPSQTRGKLARWSGRVGGWWVET